MFEDVRGMHSYTVSFSLVQPYCTLSYNDIILSRGPRVAVDGWLAMYSVVVSGVRRAVAVQYENHLQRLSAVGRFCAGAAPSRRVHLKSSWTGKCSSS